MIGVGLGGAAVAVGVGGAVVGVGEASVGVGASCANTVLLAVAVRSAISATDAGWDAGSGVAAATGGPAWGCASSPSSPQARDTRVINVVRMISARIIFHYLD